MTTENWKTNKRVPAEAVASKERGPDGKECWFVPLNGKHAVDALPARVGIDHWKRLKRRGITKVAWQLRRYKGGYLSVECSKGSIARLILNARKGKDEVRYKNNNDRTNLIPPNIFLHDRKKAKTARSWHHGKQQSAGSWERYTCPHTGADLVRKSLSGKRGGVAILDWADFQRYCIDLGIADVSWGIASGGKVVKARFGGRDGVIARVIMEAAGKTHDGFSEVVSYKDADDRTNLRRANLEKKRGGNAYYNDYKRLMALRGALPTND